MGLDSYTPDNNTIRYFGLPGDDLLDIRFFHEKVCLPHNLKLRFLGFNKGADTKNPNNIEHNVTLDEVKRLENIDSLSNIIPDDYCQIAKDESISWESTKVSGPFDIVNLDLCNGLGSHSPDSVDATHYDAIGRLVAMQARRPNPWLLFLTTRVGKIHVESDVLKIFLDLYIKNLQVCDPFKLTSKDYFSMESEKDVEEQIKTNKGTWAVNLVGIAKWILKLGLEQNPSTEVSIESVVGYHVSDATVQDLVSIAFKFTPNNSSVNDHSGLARDSSGSGSTECELATKALEQISNIQNADKLIDSDSDLKKQMTTEMESLLLQARYDISEYRQWLE